MRKLNNKLTKEAVRNYLLSLEDELNTMQQIKAKFYDECFSCPEERKRGEFNQCLYWLKGLGISVNYYYEDMAVLLAGWLDDTVDNQKEMLNKKGDRLYWELMAREIIEA